VAPLLEQPRYLDRLVGADATRYAKGYEGHFCSSTKVKGQRLK
jgi:hypothetical protein